MGEPFNETETFSLESMSDTDALFLCECLYLSDFQIDNIENKTTYFKKIVDFTNGLPFYTNKVFTILMLNYGGLPNEQNIQSSFHDLLTSPNHLKTFNHLYDRLKIYYPERESVVMLQILNFLANQNDLTHESKIIQSIDNETILITEALLILASEHYLSRSFDENGRSYIFKYEIFKKWWKLNKA